MTKLPATIEVEGVEVSGELHLHFRVRDDVFDRDPDIARRVVLAYLDRLRDDLIAGAPARRNRLALAVPRPDERSR